MIVRMIVVLLLWCASNSNRVNADDAQDPVSYLVAELGIAEAGGSIVHRKGDLKWDSNAQVVDLPSRWRTAEVIVEWQNTNWKKWLDDQDLRRPKSDTNRAEMSEIDALLLNTYSRSVSNERLGTVVIQAIEILPPAENRIRITFSQPISPFEALKQMLAEQIAAGQPATRSESK